MSLYQVFWSWDKGQALQNWNGTYLFRLYIYMIEFNFIGVHYNLSPWFICFLGKENLNSAIGLGLSNFPWGCILANLLKNPNNFFRCNIARNYDLVQLFVHVIRLNICKATSKIIHGNQGISQQNSIVKSLHTSSIS